MNPVPYRLEEVDCNRAAAYLKFGDKPSAKLAEADCNSALSASNERSFSNNLGFSEAPQR